MKEHARVSAAHTHTSHCGYARGQPACSGTPEAWGDLLAVCRQSARLMEGDLPRGPSYSSRHKCQLHLTARACGQAFFLASPLGQCEHLFP